MRSTTLTGATLLLLALPGLAGCPSSDENPPTLWLALDGRETEVRLIDHEPEPF